jgi:hypothetical protein
MSCVFNFLLKNKKGLKELIKTNIFEEIKQKVSILDVIDKYGLDPPKQKRNKYYILCPFHEEKTPSFVVFPDGGWKCFGCGASGDVVDFVAKMESISISEAVKKIKKDYLIEGNTEYIKKNKPTTQEIEMYKNFLLKRKKVYQWLVYKSNSELDFFKDILIDGDIEEQVRLIIEAYTRESEEIENVFPCSSDVTLEENMIDVIEVLKKYPDFFNMDKIRYENFMVLYEKVLNILYDREHDCIYKYSDIEIERPEDIGNAEYIEAKRQEEIWKEKIDILKNGNLKEKIKIMEEILKNENGKSDN